MRPNTAFLLSVCLLGGCGASGESGPCDTGKCGGCCLDGVCHPGTEASACGAGGVCTVCPSGTSCVDGKCGNPCDASSCPNGCCIAGGTCLPVEQQSATACGLGGYTCQSCGSDQCVNGVCQGAPACGPGTCLGCCDGAQCLPTAQQSAAKCGSGGAACAACPQGECAEGQCVDPSCDSTTCPQGCCGPQGCVLYAQQDGSACGTGGAPCVGCPQGPCAEGQCVGPACDGATCAQGCCAPQGCVLFAQQDNGTCGTGGAPCGPCGAGVSCTNGQCVSTWKVRVISAQVMDKPASDPWDPGSYVSGPLPDPFVVVQVKSSGKTGQTKYIDDTLNPMFNEEVLTETEQALAGGVTCFVKEDDGFGFLSEPMGQCTLPGLSPGQLQAGQITVAPCTNYVTQVVLGFSK